MSISKQPQASVFLVEDEALIRMMIADMVEELGHIVVAEAANINDALALAQTADFEFAILDINVGGERIDTIAEIISSRRLPFIFASGYGAAGPAKEFRHVPILQKPFVIELLAKTIEEILMQGERPLQLRSEEHEPNHTKN